MLYIYLTSLNRKKKCCCYFPLCSCALCMVFFLFLQLCCAETHTFCVSINAQHRLDVPFLKTSAFVDKLWSGCFTKWTHVGPRATMLLALSHAKASARAVFRIRGNPFGNFNCLVGEQRLFVGAL